MKSAKEMFSDLGYEYYRDSHSILYIRSYGNRAIWHDCVVTFNTVHKEYAVNDNDEYAFIGIELHKAIHKQLEELGWLK